MKVHLSPGFRLSRSPAPRPHPRRTPGDAGQLLDVFGAASAPAKNAACSIVFAGDSIIQEGCRAYTFGAYSAQAR